MYPCIKFQLTWRTSDFGNKFAPKNMSEKKNKKNNIEFETKIKQFMSVPDFSQFRELQFLRLNLPKKNFRIEYK